MPCSLHGNAWQRVASKGHESIVTCSASRPPLRCMYHELPSTSQFCRSNLPRSSPIHCIMNLCKHSCLLCPRLGVLSSCPRQAKTTHPHPDPKRSIPCLYHPVAPLKKLHRSQTQPQAFHLHAMPCPSKYCRSNLPRSTPIHCILNLTALVVVYMRASKPSGLGALDPSLPPSNNSQNVVEENSTTQCHLKDGAI